MHRTSPTQLLYLGAIGAYTLWGIAFFNGTLDRMNAAIEKGVMPDGRALRSTYTGYPLLDGRLTYLSAFYEVLSNSLTTGPRLLFLDLNFVLSSTLLWVFIESRRRGVRNISLRHPVPFAMLWNALGAAFIQPLYFYAITQSQATTRDPTIPLNEAIALFVTTIPTLLFPLFLFAPSYLDWSTYEHHGYIAKFLGTPFLMVVICVSTIALMWPKFGLVSPKDAKKPNEDKKWIVASYAMAGVIAAIVHIATIIACLQSLDGDINFTRLFVPTLSKVSSLSTASGIHNGTVHASILPVEYQKLVEGYHIFTQFDTIVVTFSCIVFVHWLLSNQGNTKTPGSKNMSGSEIKELASLVVGSVLIGPGAAGSFALAVRESRLREEKPTGKLQ
ncbi:uncharacterized protein RSE6_12471 [Rhynchosporium secalis]|uniref:Uncharacterized protein n=1 Tax=Rhynchosporium secalis TaxID=38038 RepID=A0A1E1MQI0_RHYSE|nr:uncharacterized protein RSE6_12471 [Rhynchosporium secalis]